MFTLNFTWADFILGLIDGSIMALIQLLALGLIARQHNISSITCWNPTCREFYGTYCTSQSGLELRPKNFMAINIFHWIKNKVVNGALDVVSSSGSTFRSPSLFQLIYGVTKRLYLKNFTIHIYSRVSNNRTYVRLNQKESFHLHVEHSNRYLKSWIGQQHQIVLLCKPYEIELSIMYV